MYKDKETTLISGMYLSMLWKQQNCLELEQSPRYKSLAFYLQGHHSSSELKKLLTNRDA